jgi:hypothetical protein
MEVNKQAKQPLPSHTVDKTWFVDKKSLQAAIHFCTLPTWDFPEILWPSMNRNSFFSCQFLAYASS